MVVFRAISLFRYFAISPFHFHVLNPRLEEMLPGFNKPVSFIKGNGSDLGMQINVFSGGYNVF